jgi:PhzF family phenazine biosynthesis protein
MKIPIYKVDAFTNKTFGGNPAGVCPLKEWLSDEEMQHIASENNLSETAFFVPNKSGFDLRWFAPLREVNLCGHATLSAAHVLFNHLNYPKDSISFQTKSGELITTKNNDWISMDFPMDIITQCAPPAELVDSLGMIPTDCYIGRDDFLAVFENESIIRNAHPKMDILKKLVTNRGLIITAKGDKVDFVSRFFAPAVGIDEDAVTGSAHCSLTAFWHKHNNGQTEFLAHQISERGGVLKCIHQGERVQISGQAVTFLKGEIEF